MEQRCFLGESSIENLLLVLKEFSFSHLFLVRGRNSYETCGAKSIMTAVFSELDCEVTEYFDFEENPKIEDLERGLLLLRKYSCSVIVAVGGGSVLDMAKLLRFFYSYSGEPTSGKFEKEKDLLPLIVHPTTAGTGSEATHFAVLYKNKVKYSVEHNAILPDVAIYNVSNRNYARLMSSTSESARRLGNSIAYTEYTQMVEAFKNRTVFVNRQLTENVPLMAAAILSNDEIQSIIMLWDISWDRLNLSFMNRFQVIGYLIQNAVLRANRYIDVLEHERYINGTKILEPAAFRTLLKAFLHAQQKGLTDCSLIQITPKAEGIAHASRALERLFRNSDYLGSINDGFLYVLLANTSPKDAGYVTQRIAEAGYSYRLVTDIKD